MAGPRTQASHPKPRLLSSRYDPLGLTTPSSVLFAGSFVGSFVAPFAGSFTGSFVGSFVGSFDGANVGLPVGDIVGSVVGRIEGDDVGDAVGLVVGNGEGCGRGRAELRTAEGAPALTRARRRGHFVARVVWRGVGWQPSR